MSNGGSRTTFAVILAGFFVACGASTANQAAANGPAARADVVDPADSSTHEVEATDQERKPGVAVFPFVYGGSYGEDAEDMEAFQGGLQHFLLTQLDKNEELRIVERSTLDKILREQDLAQSGRVDPRTAAKIGELVGARYMITGAFADMYGEFRMDARIIDAETGEIIETASVSDSRDKLYDLIVRLASKITDKADLPPLPPAVQKAQEEPGISSEKISKAMTLYSNALNYKRRGRTEQARKLYERVVAEFPEVVERHPDLVGAKQELEQLEESGGTSG